MLVAVWTLFSLAWNGALAGTLSSGAPSAQQLRQEQQWYHNQQQQQLPRESHSGVTRVGSEARVPLARGRVTGRAVVAPTLPQHEHQQLRRPRDENAIDTGVDEHDSAKATRDGGSLSTGDALSNKAATVAPNNQRHQQPHRQPLHHLLHRHQQQHQQGDTGEAGGVAGRPAAGVRSAARVWEVSGLVQEEGASTRTSRQTRNSASRGRNWCAYVRTRLSPTALADGSETYVGRASQQCPWTYGVCGIVYRVMQRPAYRIKHLIVTSLEWRCCPGYDGTNCEPKGPFGFVHGTPLDSTDSAIVSAPLNDEKTRPGRHDPSNRLEKHLAQLAQLQRDVANVSGALGDVRGSLRALEERVALPAQETTSNRISEDDVTELVKKLVQQQMAEMQHALYEPVRRLASSVAGLARDVEASRRDAAALNGTASAAARACEEARLVARSNERALAALADSARPHPGSGGNDGDAASAAAEEEEAAARLREELDRLRHGVADEFAARLGALRGEVHGRVDALAASVAAAELREQQQHHAAPAERPDASSLGAEDPGRPAAPPWDPHGVKETMVIHAALINDTSERVWELAQLLQQQRQREAEESCGTPCGLLAAAARDARQLALDARAAEDRIDALDRLLHVNLSSGQEELRRVTGAVRDLSRETGELRLALDELRERESRADASEPGARPTPALLLEASSSDPAAVRRLAGDVAALERSLDGLRDLVRQQAREQPLLAQGLHDDLAAALVAGLREAGERTDAAAAREEAAAREHAKLSRQVQRLYDSSKDILLYASEVSQRVDGLNGSFNTLLEDTLRHTLVLEGMGAFDESDYDDDDQEEDNDDGGGDGTPKRTVNLWDLNKAALDNADAAKRNGKLLDQMSAQVRNLRQQLDDRVANLERGFLAGRGEGGGGGGVGGGAGAGGDGDGSGDAAREGSGATEQRLRELELSVRETRQQRRFLEEKLRDLEKSCCGGGGGGDTPTIGDYLEEFRQEVERNITAVRLTLEAIPLDEVRRELIAEVSERLEAALLEAKRGKGGASGGRRRQRKKGPGRGSGAGVDDGDAEDDGGDDEAGGAPVGELPGEEDPRSHLERRKRSGA